VGVHQRSELCPLQQRLTQKGNITALELGSGAIGIAGLSMAWQLAQQTKGGNDHRIILSDRDDALLRQLKNNISNNLHILQGAEDNHASTVECQVISLDWAQPPTAVDWDLLLVGRRLDIIFGSELVYTRETAAACRDCILDLTERFPLSLVCIVQIVDRDGWQNIFLPGLRNAGLFVAEEAVDVDCDTAANLMMKRGGSLDRFDFGICYVSRSEF